MGNEIATVKQAFLIIFHSINKDVVFVKNKVELLGDRQATDFPIKSG
jgi:hypothetical protein